MTILRVVCTILQTRSRTQLSPRKAFKMRRMSSTLRDREAQRMQTDREELVERIGLIMLRDGQAEPMPGLIFNRASAPSEPIHGAMDPSFCVIAQGSKTITFGENRLRYDPAPYLITTVGMPGIGQIVEASAANPYLAVRLTLDPSIVTSAMVETGTVHIRGDAGLNAADVSKLDADLLDAVVRLVRLLDTPKRYRVLAPLIAREIVYLLLTGDQASRMRHL